MQGGGRQRKPTLLFPAAGGAVLTRPLIEGAGRYRRSFRSLRKRLRPVDRTGAGLFLCGSGRQPRPMGDSEDEFRQLRGEPLGPDPPGGEKRKRWRRQRVLPGGSASRRQGEALPGRGGEAALAAPGCAARPNEAPPAGGLSFPVAGPSGGRPDAALGLAGPQEPRPGGSQGGGGGGGGDLEELPPPLCQVCREDLSAADSVQRHEHVNRCLDAAERSRPVVPGCPLCGRGFAALRSRASHLKRCAARLKVPAPLLLQAVRLQTSAAPTETAVPNPSLPLLRRAKRKGSSSAAERSAKKHKQAVKMGEADEDLLVAVAMSRSLQEEAARTKALRLESEHWSFSKGRLPCSVLALFSAPPLLLQDPEKARKRTEERVALLLSEAEEFPPTPPLPTSCLLQAEHSREAAGPPMLPSSCRLSLWESSSLTGQCDPGSFQSAGISTPALWQESEQVRPASVLTRGGGSQEGRQPCSQEDTETLQDLLELAGEGLTLTQWTLDAQQPERLGEGLLPGKAQAALERCLDLASGSVVVRGFLLGALAEAFKGMVNNPHLSDVQFQVDSGDVVFAHTFVLYARCPQLMEVVNHSGFLVAEDGAGEIRRVLLKDATEEAVLVFLNYLYAADCTVPPHVVPEVAVLASRFGVKELAALCGGQASLAEMEGAEECSRAETFEELLKLTWMGEEDEISPRHGEEEEAKDEDMGEKDLEEIYEFAATQRKVAQEKAGERGDSGGRELEEGARRAALAGSCPTKVPKELSAAVTATGSLEMLTCTPEQDASKRSRRETQTRAPLARAECSQGSHNPGQQTVGAAGKESVDGKSPRHLPQEAQRELQLAWRKLRGEDPEDSLIVVLDSDEELQLEEPEELGAVSGQPSELPRARPSSPTACSSQLSPPSPEAVNDEGPRRPLLGKPLSSQPEDQRLFRISSDEEDDRAQTSHQAQMLVPETPLPCRRDPPFSLAERAQPTPISVTEPFSGKWPLVGVLPLSSSPLLEPLPPAKAVKSSSGPSLPGADVVVVSDSEEEREKEEPLLRDSCVPGEDLSSWKEAAGSFLPTVKDAPGQLATVPQDPRVEDGSPSLRSPTANRAAACCLKGADSPEHKPEEWPDRAGADSDDSEILPLSQRLPSTQPVQKTPDLVCQAKEMASPQTPMPCYSTMETPKLKKELSRWVFGVRALPKWQMVLKLKEIFQYTHQRSSSPATRRPELAAATPAFHKQPSEHGQLGEEVKRSQGGSRFGDLPRGGDQGWQQLAKSHDSEAESGQQKVATLFPAGVPGAGGNDGLNASQESTGSSAAGSDASVESLSSPTALETSMLTEGEEEEEEDISGSQAAACEASKLEALRLYIYSKPALCRQILLYQPIELAGLQAELKQNGIRIALGKLLDFLDAHCITFTTAEARKEKLLRRPKKKGRRRY
uniref:Structure-specific endonuclease subunit SLX4 n=1 Tax=Salvator merianae TaxID=96440 RepID=A0A8D0BKD8_SALMN